MKNIPTKYVVLGLAAVAWFQVQPITQNFRQQNICINQRMEQVKGWEHYGRRYHHARRNCGLS